MSANRLATSGEYSFMSQRALYKMPDIISQAKPFLQPTKTSRVCSTQKCKCSRDSRGRGARLRGDKTPGVHEENISFLLHRVDLHKNREWFRKILVCYKLFLKADYKIRTQCIQSKFKHSKYKHVFNKTSEPRHHTAEMYASIILCSKSNKSFYKWRQTGINLIMLPIFHRGEKLHTLMLLSQDAMRMSLHVRQYRTCILSLL